MYKQIVKQSRLKTKEGKKKSELSNFAQSTVVNSNDPMERYE